VIIPLSQGDFLWPAKLKNGFGCRRLCSAKPYVPRRKAFVATNGTDYFCPRCFIQHRTNSVLAFKFSPGPVDIIECDACGLAV
jgi:hypothetical protein